MKTIKKTFAAISLTTLFVLILLAAIILAPQNLFANHADYKNFRIFSNEIIDPKLTPLLDRALGIVKQSELYNEHFKYNIFLAHNTLYNQIDTKILGGAMAKSIDNNVILKVSLDIDRNKLAGVHNERDLTQTIAHEMIHCLQANKYGKLKFNPLIHPAAWKLEGYPEYIAMKNDLTNKNYNLKEEIHKLETFENTDNNGWYETKKGQFDPVVYVRGRLLIEYLMDIKSLTYNQILDESITANDIYSEMTKWAK